jgi:single-stranded-DNA-specific exonuclease
MLRTWLEPYKISIPQDFIQAIGGNPLVSQVLYTRGIHDIDSAKGFLSHKFYQATPSTEIPDLDKAVNILSTALAANNIIGVWGDFDVDGQTSTTVLVSALGKLGGDVIYHIPVRAEESHGISLPVLEKFLERGVELIVTCDTGVTSHDAIEFAKHKGIKVIISDHHDLPKVLPNADAIVNPKMLPLKHPLSTLPGVGVAYKIIEELYHRQGHDEEPKQYLDLVALGIVADIALLKGDTRCLLKCGLDALQNTKRAGLLAIMELTELIQSNITEEHIGFILAPRMNALGRLDDANNMVELLTTTDMGRARILALELEVMNAQRKLLSDQVYRAALAQLSTDPNLLDYPVLVLSHPTWPAGVIGVVASRLVEQYHRPVILLSAPPGQVARGSARSIEAINITEAIESNQSLLKGFGGHPMAAGIAIDPERISDFRLAISHTVQQMGIGIQAEKELNIDSYLSLPELTLDRVEDFERLAPFGSGNPPLVFVTRNLKLTGYAAVGRASEHLQLTIEDEMGHIQHSIWWQGAGYPLPESIFDLAYSVRASTYRGEREVQIEWIDYRLAESEAISLKGKKHSIEVVDFRKESDPLVRLNQLQVNEKIIVWGEAGAKLKTACLDRYSLYPAETLAIWTIPPGPNEIRSMIELVKPAKVYLFGNDPGMDELEAFVKRLVGLLKNRIKNFDGIVSISSLAIATAQRLKCVVNGLEWLDAYGYIHLISIENNEAKIETGTRRKTESAEIYSSRLNSMLAESAAFRRYFMTADKDRLVIYTE